jgi:hypothetical protein
MTIIKKYGGGGMGPLLSNIAQNQTATITPQQQGVQSLTNVGTPVNSSGQLTALYNQLNTSQSIVTPDPTTPVTTIQGGK